MKSNLNKIVENYNNAVHRGLGTSPNEALKEINFEKIYKNVQKYKKEFKKERGNKREYKCGEKVFIKNELKENKMDEEFNGIGVVVKNDYGDIYVIEDEKGCFIRKHVSQLKPFGEGKL